MPKIDETVLPVEICFFRWLGFYQVCYGYIKYTYESIFSLECFSFVTASRILERSFRNKFKSNFSDRSKKFSYLFILLIRNSVHLNLNAVSRKLKRKKRTHKKNKCFNMKYLKLMPKRFKKAFLFLHWLLFFILNTSITNKPNPSKRHLFTRFWLDKSYICNEKLLIIQLLKGTSNIEEKLKILKIENNYVIGTITAVLLFISDCRKQPFRAGLEKVFLNFMQNAWKIHMKKFAFL